MRQPKIPPSFGKLLSEEVASNSDFLSRQSDPAVRELVERANNFGWNWEECSNRSHLVKLTARQLWVLVKISRGSDRRPIPFVDKFERQFSYRLPPAAHRILHLIDTHLGGTVGATIPQLASPDDQKLYLLRSLREEAISSSLIEGAVATRQVAKEMLRAGRAPRTPGEHMIANNFRTVRKLNERRDEPLTPELLCEVQQSLTANTLDAPDGGGRFRRPDENIAVWDEEDGEPLHIPPPAAELPRRIEQMCAFANARTADADPADFIHPAIRAVILHFWLAYDHPFVDGNGRTARALFYWSMLRSGYWLAEYLTISTVINGQPKQYARAYLDTERDDGDLTYFVLYHLGVIERSLAEFRDYLEKKTRDQREVVALLVGPFNSRQRDLLRLALRDPAAQFTYASHANSHGVGIFAARADLLHLEELGLLTNNRVGRRFVFTPAAGLDERLRKVGGRR